MDLVESPMMPTKSKFGVRNPPTEVIAGDAEGSAEQLDPLRGLYL